MRRRTGRVLRRLFRENHHLPPKTTARGFYRVAVSQLLGEVDMFAVLWGDCGQTVIPRPESTEPGAVHPRFDVGNPFVGLVLVRAHLCEPLVDLLTSVIQRCARFCDVASCAHALPRCATLKTTWPGSVRGGGRNPGRARPPPTIDPRAAIRRNGDGRARPTAEIRLLMSSPAGRASAPPAPPAAACRVRPAPRPADAARPRTRSRQSSPARTPAPPVRTPRCSACASPFAPFQGPVDLDRPVLV